MLASVSQVRDDAAHAQCVEARRFGGCDHAGGHHSMRAGLRQDRDGHCRQVHDKCTKNVLGTLYSGIFTFGTDQPVYPPWYMGENPASGEGFEAAVAYAVAAKMNYANQDVRWVRVPFNAALAPGPKTFDANLSEFSITDQRKAAVDFSSPYFDVTQAVVTVKSSPAAGVKTVHQLRTLRRCPGGHHKLLRGDVGGR
jgi:hypothetical protein